MTTDIAPLKRETEDNTVVNAAPETTVVNPAKPVTVNKPFLAGLGASIALGVIALIALAAVVALGFRISENVAAEAVAESEARMEEKMEAAIEDAVADYDQRMRETIIRDRQALNAYYEETTREVDSYVMWRLDEALRESNRIISDAINDAERIRADNIGVSQIGATE